VRASTHAEDKLPAVAADCVIRKSLLEAQRFLIGERDDTCGKAGHPNWNAAGFERRLNYNEAGERQERRR
jgi:hypothetical protein